MIQRAVVTWGQYDKNQHNDFPNYNAPTQQKPNSFNKNHHEPADKFVGLVQSKPTSLCFILQNNFVGLVPSQPTNLLAGS
jgi:hypothetical protein